MHHTLAKLVIENKRLAMDETHQLESMIRGVHDAMSQLKSEIKRPHGNIGGRFKARQAVAPTDTVAIAASSEIMRGLSEKLLSLAEGLETTAYYQMVLESLWFDNIKTRQENVATSHE